jgi:hypothetical protein
MSSGVGAPWGRGDVTIYMKRMWDFSYGEPPAPPPLHSLANESTNQPPADRHPRYKKTHAALRTHFYDAGRCSGKNAAALFNIAVKNVGNLPSTN